MVFDSKHNFPPSTILLGLHLCPWKVGEITRLFIYDLNQISYDYAVEVTNRLKELDLIDRVPEELQAEVCHIVQEAVIKKRKAIRQNSCLSKPYK